MADSPRGFHVEIWRTLKRSHWWLASLLLHSLLLGGPALVDPPTAPEGRTPSVLARLGSAPAPVLDEVEPEIIETEPVEEEETVLGPVVRDIAVADHCETDADLPFEESGWFACDAPFDGPSTNSAVGIGGGAGGAFGGRGGHRNLRAGGGGWGGGRAAGHLLVIEEAVGSDEPPTFRGLPLTEGMLLAQEAYPGTPVLLVGRYAGGGQAVLTVRGRRAGRPFEQEIPIALPDWDEGNEVLAAVWARCRIEALMDVLRHRPDAARREITDLGLEFRLVTPFTSFVAVDGSRAEGGEAWTLRLPLPDGVVYSGAWNDGGEYCEIRPFGLFMARSPRGLRVFRVRKGSPAHAAGIREGDLVRAVNGTRAATGGRREGTRLTVDFLAEE